MFNPSGTRIAGALHLPTRALINNQEDRLGEYAAMGLSGQQQWKGACNHRSQAYTTD